MIANGSAPEVATLRYASARASCAPAYGSSRVKRALQSVARATPRPESSSIRRHSRIVGLREHGIASYVAVVLISDPRLVTEVGRADHAEQGVGELLAAGWSLKLINTVGLDLILPLWPVVGTLVNGTLVSDSARRHVDHRLSVPVDHQPVPPATSPITVASTSHLRQIARKAST